MTDPLERHTTTRQTKNVDHSVHYAFRCKCGWHSNWYPSLPKADDEQTDHFRNVKRARSGLQPTPTLKTAAKYYREMAERADQPAEHRRLWKQLADEVDKRLNQDNPHEGQDSLF